MMALRRPITKALACTDCQQWILRPFIASIGGRPALQPTPISQHRRSFSRTPQRHNEARERIQQEKEEHALNDINEEVLGTSEPDSEPVVEKESQEAHMPWYLQVQQPIEARESPLAARQRIPDLPQHPPSILQPLLEHVSVELGMDDLSLLDLRALDPPPGLGANLLMIVGTARSEKHLHVSADRLCRWLRTEHKLRPYADGLLGRNELKLKMRRKAKRSRLLSAVGARATADEDDADDGIRTGWVCVNLGRVKGGELPTNQAAETAEGVVGFGSARNGSSVVLQMMTEEKRGEIDLETLWQDMLGRQVKRKAKEQAEEDENVPEAEAERAIPSETENGAEPLRQQSALGSSYYAGAHVPNHIEAQQLHAYHASH